MKPGYLVGMVVVGLLFSGCTKEPNGLQVETPPSELPGENVPEGIPEQPRVITPTKGTSESYREIDNLERELNGVEIDTNLNNNIQIDE